MQDLLYATQWVRAGAGDTNIVRYWLSKGVLYSSVTMFHSITPLTTSLDFCILGYVGSKCEALSYRSNHAVHTITISLTKIYYINNLGEMENHTSMPQLKPMHVQPAS